MDGVKLLGIDYGRSRVGIAVADQLGIATTPIGFIARDSDEQAAKVVAILAQREQVGGLVYGLPLHAHGDAGQNVKWVRAFQREVAKLCSLPAYEVDERYTSAEAEEALKAEGKWPAKPGDIDARAAAIILRRYLDGDDIVDPT